MYIYIWLIYEDPLYGIFSIDNPLYTLSIYKLAIISKDRE